MAMLNPNPNLGSNAAVVGAVVRLLRQARNDVSSTLVLVGFLMCFTAAGAAVSSPPLPAESLLAYPATITIRGGAIAASFIGGLGAMWAAGWIADDPARRRGTGWIILCACLVLMMVNAVCLSDEFVVFFNILREIA